MIIWKRVTLPASILHILQRPAGDLCRMLTGLLPLVCNVCNSSRNLFTLPHGVTAGLCFMIVLFMDSFLPFCMLSVIVLCNLKNRILAFIRLFLFLFLPQYCKYYNLIPHFYHLLHMLKFSNLTCQSKISCFVMVLKSEIFCLIHYFIRPFFCLLIFWTLPL